MKTILVLLLMLALPVWLFAQPGQPPGSQPLAFTHVTVIDSTSANPKPDHTVIIMGDRITALGKADEIKVSAEAQLVDATGQFLIPGLWDMHVHWYGRAYLPLFLANGVTGVRLMFGAPIHLQWRQELAEGKLLGPRMILASPIVDGPKPMWPGSIAVSDEADGRQAVMRVKKDGWDFVKVYSFLPRDAYFAIADEAKQQHILFAGHVPEDKWLFA
jgi:hypothetical protein